MTGTTVTSFLLTAFPCIIVQWISSSAVAATQCSSNSSYSVKTGHSSAVNADNGSSLCAVDPPSDITPSVRSLLDCQRICSRTTGCWNFNYFQDTKRCELFDFQPTSLVTGILYCKHYQVKALVKKLKSFHWHTTNVYAALKRREHDGAEIRHKNYNKNTQWGHIMKWTQLNYKRMEYKRSWNAAYMWVKNRQRYCWF